MPILIAASLTTGIDTITGNSNMNVQGTGTTFTQYDSITGSAFNDSLTINDSTGASASGVPAGVAVTGIETMTVNSNGSIGKAGTAAVPAGSATTAAQQTATVTYTVTNASTISVVINGTTYTSGTLTADTTGANAATALVSLINAALGASYAAASTGVVTITSQIAGTPLPTISVSGAGGVTTGLVAGTANSFLATGPNALAQVETLTVGGTISAGAMTVFINGNSYTTTTGTSTTTAAANIAAIINQVLGSTVATASSAVVTLTAPQAGTPLPIIFASGGNLTYTPAVVTSNQAAITAAVPAVAAINYDVSGFTGLTTYNASSSGGENVKVAATTDLVARNINGGDVVIDGGKVVTVTTAVGTATGTTTSAVNVSGKALTSVSITGGTGATVNNKENTTAAADNAGTTLTAVSLTSVDGNSTVGGKGLVNVTVAGATTAARTVTITNSTLNHTQNLTLNNTGYTSADADAKTVVTDAAARTLNVVSSGTKNLVNLNGNTSATALNISGAGKLTADVNSLSLLAAIDGSAATGALVLGTLNAATVAVTTGSGNDTMTIAATATTTVRTGAGNDKVSLSSAIAAGSTIDLGDGNDSLLYVATGSVATGASSTGAITRIDGGAGTDTLSATLVNNGNKALFTNFEVLALDLTSGTFDTTLVTGLTGLSLVSAGGGTYTGVTTAQALTISNTATPTGTTTLTMTGVSGTADSYSISFAGADQTAIPTAANILGGAFAVAGIENFNIVSGGGVNTWNSLTLAADANANTVTITGAKNLNLAFDSISSVAFGSVTAPLTGVSSIDGSAATGKLAINITNVVQNATGLVVKGGAGVDTITTSSAAYGTLFGGAAGDSFVVLSTVTGSGYATAPKYNTIADIALGDTITLATSATAQTTLGAAQSTATATSLVGALTAIAAATDAVSWGTYGGNTYVVWDDGTAGLSAADVVVCLTGTSVGLTNASLATTGVLTIA